VKEAQMAKSIIELHVDRGMAQVSINLKPDIIKRVDVARGSKSRSGFIADCVVEHFTPRGEADIKQIIRLESEVEYLRIQNTSLLDAMSQRLLAPDVKVPFWRRVLGRKKE
jgi:hypothetical protein